MIRERSPFSTSPGALYKDKTNRTEVLARDRLETIGSQAAQLTRVGAPAKQIAEKIIDLRNTAKVDVRAYLAAQGWQGTALRLWAEARNKLAYGNKVGPSAQWLFDRKRRQMLQNGQNPTEDEVWHAVIQGASRSSAEYDAVAEVARRILMNPLGLIP